MSGIATICVGKKKTGKTTISKKLLAARPDNFPVCIYDINREYTNLYPDPLIDFDEFLEKIIDLRGHYILIEEATIFFSTSSRFKEMINVLVRARHTRNIIQLNFHSFQRVPKNIYELLDYVIVFKTNDNIKDVKDKFDNPEIIQAFENVRNSNNPYFSQTVRL